MGDMALSVFLHNRYDHRIEHVSFLLGLLVSCFVLGAIYHLTHSLWLCVLYHCLLNTFSQTLEGNGKMWGMLSSVICILLAIVGVRKKIVKQKGFVNDEKKKIGKE